ncbi:hypothetical protein BG006_002061 [Podila minutissima]|uniref:BTB domain-containing protein n=1 Tax=Podila minutissima TaxID=64525 RepID=A0A9P5S9N2_9FUNG|nr:hypothetical protein BG006_002061 [Podila minutissima]
MTQDQDGIDHLEGLALLPLEDGTWINLFPSPVFYTADVTARSLLKTHKNLVKESVFSTPNSQKILRWLERDPWYGFMPLPPSKFTKYIRSDYGTSVPPPMVPKIWGYIRDNRDLSGFADLPILTTIWGSVVPLRSCERALRVSENDRMDSELMLHKLSKLLQNAGIVVFRSDSNERYIYLESKSKLCNNGGYDVQNLGDNPSLIKGEYNYTFGRMGTSTVSLADFIRNHVIPRLLSHLINPHASHNHMEAYLLLLKTLMDITRGTSSLRFDALNLLQSGHLILARDGPDLPHAEVWNMLQHMSAAVSGFWRSTQDTVLVECAQIVLEETEPYASSAPPVPAYASFTELVCPSTREFAWTQKVFFPTDLEPTQSFKDTYPAVGHATINDVVTHLHVLAKDLTRTWRSDSDQLSLRLALLATYSWLSDFAAKSGDSATTLSDLLTATMTVPYIFSGFGKEMHDPEAWCWPTRLILDVDDPTATKYLVHAKLQKYHSFLVAAGVRQLLSVEGHVIVAPPPNCGELETLLCNLFESQDLSCGFMDVCFRFQPHGGQDSFAHKIVLAHRSAHFKARFLGIWAQHSYNPTPLNGLPVPSQESQAQSVNMRDPLSEQVEYLLLLLKLADDYQITRLKDLIAFELVVGQMIVQGNVFEVREHADLARCRPVVEHCEKYIKTNTLGLRSFVLGEIALLQREQLEGGRVS